MHIMFLYNTLYIIVFQLIEVYVFWKGSFPACNDISIVAAVVECGAATAQCSAVKRCAGNSEVRSCGCRRCCSCAALAYWNGSTAGMIYGVACAGMRGSCLVWRKIKNTTIRIQPVPCAGCSIEVDALPGRVCRILEVQTIDAGNVRIVHIDAVSGTCHILVGTDIDGFGADDFRVDQHSANRTHFFCYQCSENLLRISYSGRMILQSICIQ